ncbi:MAG: hypothetical protein PBV00_13280 [Pseudomonas asiatica]
MDATSKTRFHASRRLRLHAKLSTYTVVILSLVLILVSLGSVRKEMSQTPHGTSQ